MSGLDDRIAKVSRALEQRADAGPTWNLTLRELINGNVDSPPPAAVEATVTTLRDLIPGAFRLDPDPNAEMLRRLREGPGAPAPVAPVVPQPTPAPAPAPVEAAPLDLRAPPFEVQPQLTAVELEEPEEDDVVLPSVPVRSSTEAARDGDDDDDWDPLN
jgi:hypothetical protein